MLDINTISVIVGLFAGAGVLIAGFGYAYAQFKRGGSEADAKTIVSLKEYIATLEERNKRLSDERAQLIASHSEQINKLTKELGELKGRFDEQSKKAQEYKEMLLGRDPEMTALFKEVKTLLAQLNAKKLGK